MDLTGLKERAEAKKNAPAGGPAAGPQGAAGGVPQGGAAGGGIATSVKVSEANFEDEVLRRSMQVPVIVELGSDRAPVQMTVDLANLAAGDGGKWVHAFVDVDQNPMVAQAFRAKAVPTVIIVAAGRPLGEFEGEQPKEVLRQLVDQVLEQTAGQLEGMPAPAAQESAGEAEGPADPERDAAESALAEGDLPAAEEKFQALVDSRPGDHTLVEALRFVQVSRRVAEENDPAAAGQDEKIAGVLRQADVSVMAGNYAAGFTTLIDAIRVAAGDTKNLLRTRLLELLETLPTDDAEVLAARRNLATALY